MKTGSQPTSRQKEIYDFIVDRTITNSRPPTVREIKERFGFASTQAVQNHLVLMQKKGLIRRTGLSRGIEVVRLAEIHAARKRIVDAAVVYYGDVPSVTSKSERELLDAVLSYRRIM